MIDYSPWLWMGIFYLIVLTYQDFKHNCMVDDRHNFFMMGLTLAYFFMAKVSLLMNLLVLAIVIVMYILLKKFNLIGSADINSLTWIILGWYGLSTMYLVTFLIIYTTINLIFLIAIIIIKKLNKITENKPVPYYSVLLGSFFLNMIFYYLSLA